MKQIFLAIIIIFIVGCNQTQSSLEEIRRKNDPDKMKLSKGWNDYVKRTDVSNVELGIIYLKNGKQVKYWFMSHHLTDDKGGTIFEFDDKSTIYMEGKFCCELQLPDIQLNSENELKNFIKSHHGISP